MLGLVESRLASHTQYCQKFLGVQFSWVISIERIKQFLPGLLHRLMRPQPGSDHLCSAQRLYRRVKRLIDVLQKERPSIFLRRSQGLFQAKNIW